jgi:RRXRR protein
MRLPVVDTRGTALMPCTAAKARHLFKSGKARPKRNKLGLFSVQLCYEQEPTNQPLVAGIDPGSKFEGYSVVGTKETVLNLMGEAPNHVKDAVQTRRTMRRARRFRKWRRPKRFDNRLNRKQRIPPSTRSRWEAKARVVMQLRKVLPLTDVVVEDVQAVTRKGKAGKWNGSFSPVQVGKEHLYRVLREMGLQVHLKEGWQTKELREKYGLKKTKSKSKPSFESHAVDGWVLAASVSGAAQPTCTRLWYVVGAVLHRLQAASGGERKPYGGTRSLGYKRGTLVRHPKYGLCTVGGFDRKRQTLSLHAYRTNKRLTQGASGKDCRILTWVAWRSWLVRAVKRTKKGKGATHPRAARKGTPLSSRS